MVALLVSLAITAVMVGVVVLFARRRATGAPLTWGEAFVAGTFVFALMLMLYGIVPNQWLLWADNELGWRSDKLFLGDDGLNFGGRGRILISYQVFRDVIAAGIYVVFLGGQFYVWTWWQKRRQRAATAATAELGSSAYGRPIVKKV